MSNGFGGCFCGNFCHNQEIELREHYRHDCVTNDVKNMSLLPLRNKFHEQYESYEQITKEKFNNFCNT